VAKPLKKTCARGLLLALTVFVSAQGLACGPREPAKAPTNVVVVLVDTRGRKLPFDPEAMRAKRAREAVDKVALRPIALSIDMALLPEDTEAREAYVADVLEALARGLDAERTRDREGFAAATGALAEVSLRYEPLNREPTVKLSEDGRAIVCATSRVGAPPIASAAFVWVIRERDAEKRRARYASRRAEDVPANEREAYLRALLDHDGIPREARARAAYLADRTLSLLDLLALAEKDRSPLAGKIRHEVVASGGDVLQEIAFHHHEALASAPRDASIRRAEARYAAFLRADFAKLGEEDALAAARMAFARANMNGAPTRYVLPSFDRQGFAIDTLTAWKKRGQGPDATTPVMHAVVCPEEKVRSGNRIATSRSGYCTEELYLLAREDATVRRALVAYTKREEDVGFARLLFGRLARDRAHLATTFEAVRETWGSKLFPAAIEALAEATLGSGDAAFVSEARSFVRALPDARGDVAYLVARALTYRASEDVFTHFGDQFEGPLTLRDYERFMAYGDHAVESTPAVIPAFAEGARGAPRIRVLLTRLDGFLDRAEERRAEGRDSTFPDLRDRLCAEDDHAGVAEMARALAERRKKHPGEVLTEIFAEGCPKKDPSAARPLAKAAAKGGPKGAAGPPRPPGPRAPRPHGAQDLVDPFSKP